LPPRRKRIIVVKSNKGFFVRLIGLGLLLTLVGCATTLRHYGIAVRVVKDAALIKDCRYIQEVQASSSWGGLVATGIGYRSAMNELKNEAGAVGGNTVLLAVMANTMGGTNMSGGAYRCNR